MKTIQDVSALNYFSGLKMKRAIVRSGFTKEQVVAYVQDKGLSFSLAGLDRMYRNELPKTEPTEILAGIAEKLKCSLGDFSGLESSRIDQM